MKPKVCILRTDGTNCDEELFYAFKKYGAEPYYVHVNQLRNKAEKLKKFQILAIPGGFSYGDDVTSGKILAIELVSFLKEEIQDFINKKGLVLGICNGFQVLVRTGLLPFGHLGEMDATLAQNESGHFECRWVKIKIEDNKAVLLKPYENQIVEIAVNHGEGRFFGSPDIIKKVEKEKLVFCRYVNGDGRPTKSYPANPNGAVNSIAGVTDPSGRILGLMPHPEKIVDLTQHPNWRRGNVKAMGGFIFEGMVKYAKDQ